MNGELVANIRQLISQCDYEELESAQRMVIHMRKTLDSHYLSQVKVGSVIVFDYRGQTHMGKVIRINKKTVTFIDVKTQREARVSMGLIVKSAQKHRDLNGGE